MVGNHEWSTSIRSLIKRAPSRDALLFVRHVKPFDWYVTGVVYTDEASAPGKQLSFLLIAAILAATLFILPVALLMVTRLTSPLAKGLFHKAIIQSGIREIVYLSDKYADSDATLASKTMLRAAGVQMRQLKPHTEQIVLDFRVDK